MIKEVTGDILLSACKVIAHGVAPNDDFKSSLAHSLREQWPSLYKDFRHYCHSQSPKPGTIWTWTAANGLRIVNLFTQDPPQSQGDHPGKAHLEFVNHALRDLRQLATEEKFASIALPRLATGVGRLPWPEVQPLVAKYLGDLKIPVFVYVNFKKGVRADEKMDR